MSTFLSCPRRAIWLLLLLAAAGSPRASLFAQATRYDVTGVIADTSDAGLSGATVVILQRSDSSLVRFGVTRPDGSFRVGPVANGAYLLQVTFIGFTPHTQPLSVEGAPVVVGRIQLKEAVSGLDELVVTAEHIPIVIKKDTLEFNAAAFQMRPNASVEDLLKRLPGVEVERDGSIKAQGETVKKVLVDGKEFFGNDPTVATRNLPADAVDKVQVYDKQSDMAELTGVSDGDESRTINLELKKNRKQGAFGNLSGGVGDLQRYEGRASVNRFSAATQFSFIGNVNNINQQGFNMGEYINFMGGMQNMMAGGGGRFSQDSAPVGNETSSGFATTVSGGVNFNRDFNAKTSVRASYLAYYLDNEQDRSVQQHQLSGARASALARQAVDQESQTLNHRLNLNLKQNFGDGHDLQARANLQASDSDLVNLSNRETRNPSDVLENTSRTDYASDNSALSGDASLTYRRRLAPGRSVVAEARASRTDGTLTGELAALNTFYRQGNVLTSEEIAQLQEQRSGTVSHTEKLSYTEPLGTGRLGQLTLEHRGVFEDQAKDVFDRLSGAPGRNEALSSAFDRAYLYYKGGLNYRHVAGPLNARVGVDVQYADLEGQVHNVPGRVDRGFTRLLPSASLAYEFGTSKNTEVRYMTTTREPSMRDLQPFADNSDPLNVYVGNPLLRPEYTHSALWRFMFFDQFSFVNLFASVRASYTLDKIVRDRTVDAQLRQHVTTTNEDGDWTLSGHVSFGAPIRPLGLKTNISTQTVYNRGIEYLNGERNETGILRSTWDVRLENRSKTVVDASVGARFTFNDVRYALNPGLDQRYVNQTYYGAFTYTVAEAWRLTTTLDYTRYAKDVFGDGASIPLLGAEISRTLLNNRVEVKLVGRDLLNQNVGVNYTNTSTYIQEERIQSLGRYVMLKAIFNLSPVRPANSGPRVIIE